MSTFGERLKKMRLLKNMTQDELAEEFNRRYGYSFTKATISQYENNRRTPEITVIMRLVEFFNLSLDYLLCNDLYKIKEISSVYMQEEASKGIELEDLIGMVKNISAKGKVTIDAKGLDAVQIQTLHNGLDIILELVIRNRYNSK